jgi:hypothetical protein
MPRIRSIKPEFFKSAKIGALSARARLLFVGTWTEADDYGNLLGSAKYLSGAIFPFDSDATPRRVNAWLQELTDAALITPYEVEGVRYLHIRGWDEHQKISHPGAARAPDFPNGTVLAPEAEPHSSGDPPEQRRSRSDDPPLGAGSMEQGTGSSSREADPEPAANAAGAAADLPTQPRPLAGLLALGVMREVAVDLIAEHGPDNVRRQLEWLPARQGIKRPAAAIVKAVREGWEQPETAPARAHGPSVEDTQAYLESMNGDRATPESIREHMAAIKARFRDA